MRKIKRIQLIVLIIFGLSLGLVNGQAMAAGENWLDGFTYRLEITVDNSNIGSDLTAYPLPLFINSSAGITSYDLSLIFDEVGENWEKIAVTKSDGDTQIYVEVEKWDSAGEDALLWVSKSDLVLTTASTTTLYFYYDGYADDNTSYVAAPGSRSEVWDDNYMAVWHFSEASGNIIDSTSNDNDSTTVTGSPDYRHTGQLGYSVVNDAAEEGFIVPDSADFTLTDFTITSIIEPAEEDPSASYNYWVNKYDGGSGDGFNMFISNSNDGYYVFTHYLASVSDTATSTNGAPEEEIQLIHSISNSGIQYIYIDGQQEGTTGENDGEIDSSGNLILGYNPYNPAYGLIGTIDEIRISDIARSDDWVVFTYYSTDDLAVTYSNPEEGLPIIVMGDSTLSSTPSGLVDAMEVALNTYRPDSELGLEDYEMSNLWAITGYDESDTEDYYWITLTGLRVTDRYDLDGWELYDSLWYGTAIAHDNGDTSYTGHVDGSSGYTIMVDAASIADIANQSEGGTGSAYYYFPWAAGFRAYYGSKGVHGAGDNLGFTGGTGWKAVDWVGGTTGFADGIYPNGVYVSQSGVVSATCRDDIQTWVQIGDFIYAHLVDNSTLRQGQYHSQGSYLGALVTGTHLTPAKAYLGCPGGGTDCIDARCGYMYQQPDHYHLHWGFKPSGGYLTIEGWTLNIDTGIWYGPNNGQVGPAQYMLADWANNIIVPTPGPTVTPGGPTVTPNPDHYLVPDQGGGGGQIWDGFIAGMKTAVQNRVDKLQETTGGDGTYGTIDGNGRRYIQIAVSGLRLMIRTAYVLLHSNLNLSVTIAIIIPILVAESIRGLGSLWMWIKSKIPFIG